MLIYLFYHLTFCSSSGTLFWLRHYRLEREYISGIFLSSHLHHLRLDITKGSNECPTPTQISAIVPVYNQTRIIPHFLSRIRDAPYLTNLNFEIIVFNDGSSDKTLAILETEKGNDPKMKVISHSWNKGKGYAIKEGVMQSSGNITYYSI